MFLHKFIFLLGAKFRNPSYVSSYNKLKRNEDFTQDEIKEYQISEIKKFLMFVSEHSVYYQKKFLETGFNAKEFCSLDQLDLIEPISKTDLIKNTDNIHTINNFKFSKLFFCETSGTSGQVLKFYRNEEWDSMNRAAIMRGYSWYGVKPWDKNGYFWGYNLNGKSVLKVRFLDFLQNRFRLFSYDESGIKGFIQKLKGASFMHGYSSMIYEVAKAVNKKNISVEGVGLKMIKGTSEKIYDNYHDEVRKAFGLKIVSEYGAAEAGIIAFECPEGNMHINTDGVFVETTETNEILVTNFLSYSFPIIRYKLGDYVTISPRKCTCAMNHPIITDVLGRVGKNVYGKKSLYPSLTFYYVFKNLALNHELNLNFQAIQETKGSIVLKIEQKLDLDQVRLIGIEMKKYFSDDLQYELLDSQSLHMMDGKLKDFISHIEAS